MNVTHLIQSARRVVRVKGRPREVELRRAVSDCYYALFHALAKTCADAFVGSSRGDSEAYVRVYRGLDHARAKQELDRWTRRSDCPPALRTFGAAFVELQELRHRADYDPLPFRHRKKDAETVIRDAEAALADLNKLGPDHRSLLAATLLLKSRP